MVINPFWGSGSGEYLEDGYLGYFGAAPYGYAGFADTKNALPVTVPSPGVYAKRIVVRVYSSTTGTQIRSLVYAGTAPTATLVKTGIDITLPTIVDTGIGDAGTDIDLWFNSDHSSIYLPAGSYLIGFQESNTIGVNEDSAGNTTKNSDTYADGLDAVFGTASLGAGTAKCKMPYSANGP